MMIKTIHCQAADASRLSDEIEMMGNAGIYDYELVTARIFEPSFCGTSKYQAILIFKLIPKKRASDEN